MGIGRFGIAGLMGTIAVVAIGLAALSRPTEFWVEIVFTTAVGLALAAIVAAIATKGRDRATYSGAAVFAWGYLTAAFGPGLSGNVGNHLITGTLISLLWHDCPMLIYNDLLWISHSLVSIAAAVCGGLLARTLWVAPEDGRRSTLRPNGQP